MRRSVLKSLALILSAFAGGLFALPAHADVTLLNVSYDVTREFYKDYNAAFARHWKQATGETLTLNQSHGGSSKQAGSVVAGLAADVITMNQASDIDILAERGGLVPADWAKRLPHNSSPTTSVTVILVRKATTTFAQRNIGDALVTFESEVPLIQNEFAGDYQVVYPKTTILAENPVSVVDKVVDKKGTRKQAEAYLKHLYSDEGQAIAVKHNLRPRSPALLKQHQGKFISVPTFTVDEVFGGWSKVQAEHFRDGGLYDQISLAGRAK